MASLNPPRFHREKRRQTQMAWSGRRYGHHLLPIAQDRPWKLKHSLCGSAVCPLLEQSSPSRLAEFDAEAVNASARATCIAWCESPGFTAHTALCGIRVPGNQASKQASEPIGLGWARRLMQNKARSLGRSYCLIISILTPPHSRADRICFCTVSGSWVEEGREGSKAVCVVRSVALRR
ncbi:hypothetical protein LY76DRAFT_594787 [Colletotrichum caudatum]|nr:hypothetical protein LY76DRAFT_594787 [Colletotrichum caudatum]